MTLASTVSVEPTAPSDVTYVQQTSRTVVSEHERWAAWQARGAAHDRAVWRRMAFVAPILIVAIAVAVVLLSQ